AVHMRKLCLRRSERLDSPVEDDFEIGPALLQTMDASIVERRYVAVLLRAQALEPCLARMHDEARAARAGDLVDEAIEALLGILIVDADAAFDGDGKAGACHHLGDARAHKRGLGHEASAEAARLHPVRRAAHVEVDLVVTEIRADPRGLRELVRIAAAELQRERMLG